MANNKKSNAFSNLCAGILGVGGLFAVVSAAGTEDYRDQITESGIEDDDIASKKATNALALFGAAAMGGAALIVALNDKKKSR